jgi:hypothetical protein
MRSIFFGVIVLFASTAVADAAQAEKHDYAQALVSRRQAIQVNRERLIGLDQAQPDEDALTIKIERDRIRLDRLIEICPSC